MKRFLSVAIVTGLLNCQQAVGQDWADTDPIDEIAAYMDLATGHLGKKVTGEPTQTTQKTVITKLDELIEKLEKECEACRGSGASGANPTRPLADSKIIGGPGGSGDLHAARSEGDDWGRLPPHERDRILQSLTEGFPPHYQRILERYYRRLAEEAPDDESDDSGSRTRSAPRPGTNPAPKPAETSGTTAAEAQK